MTNYNMRPERMSKSDLILIIFIVILIVGGYGYFAFLMQILPGASSLVIIGFPTEPYDNNPEYLGNIDAWDCKPDPDKPGWTTCSRRIS